MTAAQAADPLLDLARRARTATAALRMLERDRKDAILLRAAAGLRASLERLVTANARDLEVAREMGLGDAAMDRLRLDAARVDAMAAALEEVAALPDPVGEVTGMWRRPNGLQVGRVRIPIGVILIIYESRPNVTSDAAGLCLKSGNAVILRGGRESFHSNIEIGAILREACVAEGLTADAIQVVPDTERASIYRLLELEDEIDLVIPRGGEALIRAVSERSRIPVLKHYKGVCHVFVEAHADLDRAEVIVVNAKAQRPGVCNAMETLLVDRAIAEQALPRLVAALRAQNVRLKGCGASRAIVPDLDAASDDDWGTEWLDLAACVRVVDGLDGAADHVARWGSQHTEAIVTQDWDAAQRFLRMIDSSTVVVNASTRFADGGELGLGAEIGISTSKLHAFGPMGLEELTTRKFIVLGHGQIRG